MGVRMYELRGKMTGASMSFPEEKKKKKMVIFIVPIFGWKDQRLQFLFRIFRGMEYGLWASRWGRVTPGWPVGRSRQCTPASLSVSCAQEQ